MVPALLRACLSGDGVGASVIVESADPQLLVFAVAAWVNEYGITTQGGAREWDGALAEIQRRTSGA